MFTSDSSKYNQLQTKMAEYKLKTLKSGPIPFSNAGGRLFIAVGAGDVALKTGPELKKWKTWSFWEFRTRLTLFVAEYWNPYPAIGAGAIEEISGSLSKRRIVEAHFRIVPEESWRAQLTWTRNGRWCGIPDRMTPGRHAMEYFGARSCRNSESVRFP